VSAYLVGTYAFNVMFELCSRGLHVEIILGRGSVGLVRVQGVYATSESVQGSYSQ